MPSTFTSSQSLEKPAAGEQSNTWWESLNTNFDKIDVGIQGLVSVTQTTSVTLLENNGAIANSDYASLKLVGTLASDSTLNLPLSPRSYDVINSVSMGDFNLTIQHIGAPGTGVLISAGSFTALRVVGDGENVTSLYKLTDSVTDTRLPNDFTSTTPVGRVDWFYPTARTTAGLSTLPTGYYLCNGQTVNGIPTPDLRNMFIKAATSIADVSSAGVSATTVTATVSGELSATLTANNIPELTVSVQTGTDVGDVSTIITRRSNATGLETLSFTTGKSSPSAVTMNASVLDVVVPANDPNYFKLVAAMYIGNASA